MPGGLAQRLAAPGAGPADEGVEEDIIGVVTALEYWFGERDAAAEQRKWYDDCAAVAERLAGSTA